MLRYQQVGRTTTRFVSTRVIGIDLGTTNSAVAYIRDSNNLKSATIIENSDGQRTTPSIVAYKRDGEVLVGDPARRQAIVNPQNTFFATKRLIGRAFDDPEVQNDLDKLPYKVVENQNTGNAYLQTSFGEVKSPAEVGSAILSSLRTTAEEYLNTKIDKAVITVPAYFNDSQRQATKEAGTMVGLKVLRVVNEPTAAALSFGLDSKNDGIVAVYDLGGGTFDISILDIEDGVFEVKSTNGDTHLGGEDFDNVLVNYILDVFIRENPDIERTMLMRNNEAMQRIKENAEKAKIELSHVKEANVDIPFIFENRNINLKIQEEELDRMTLHLIEKTIQPVKKALQDAEVEPEDISDVILVGGMTRMPKVRAVVEKLFKKKANTSVNPDETVALGAAIQGGILSGEIKNILLLDVTPLTLGIETYGGVFSPLIPRNSTIPVKKTEVFSTGIDGQTGVKIGVYQGERGLVRDNSMIGNFTLAGIPPMPKGVPQVHVTFDIDADGIINVSAQEKSTGQEQSITVIPNTGLTEEEIQRVINDANLNKDKDIEMKKKVDIITKSDFMISDTENAFENYHDVISSEDAFHEVKDTLQKVRTKINNLKNDATSSSSDLASLMQETNDIQKRSLELFRSASTKQNKK